MRGLRRDDFIIKMIINSAYASGNSIEMFHDPGEFQMVDPIFVHHKRWHSVSFEELRKESSNFQRPDFT